MLAITLMWLVANAVGGIRCSILKVNIKLNLVILSQL